MNYGPLRVLITNIIMSGRTGTEIVVRDLALGLLRRQHRPIVYTQATGALSDELRRAGIPVVTSIDQIGSKIDVIHGHHNPVTAVAAMRFPEAPAIFVCHDFAAWHDVAPLLPNIRRYVAVDTTVAERLSAEQALPDDQIRLFLNAVDMARFVRGPPPAQRPRNALAFAKNQGHIEAISEACRVRGIAVDFVGAAVNKIVAAPEAIVNRYDLVFTSALSALECLACGRAVIVCDGRGLAGFVTPERYESWRPMNFGLRTLLSPVVVGNLLDEIDRYDSNAAAIVGERVRREADLSVSIDRVVELYREVIDEHRSTPVLPAATASAAARHLELWMPRLDQRWPWVVERNLLLERVRRLERELKRAVIGAPLLFSDEALLRHCRLVSGFGEQEADGAWTDGNVSVLHVKLPDRPREELTAIFDTHAFLVDERPNLAVDVCCSGERIGVWRYDLRDGSSHAQHKVVVPPSAFDADGLWNLKFFVHDPRSPVEVGYNTDARRLGIKFISLVFQSGNPPDFATA